MYIESLRHTHTHTHRGGNGYVYCSSAILMYKYKVSCLVVDMPEVIYVRSCFNSPERRHRILVMRQAGSSVTLYGVRLAVQLSSNVFHCFH